MYRKNFDAYIAAWNDGNLDGLDAYVASNMTRTVPATMNSNASNLTELKQTITDFRTAFPDLHVEIDELLFYDNRSILRWTFTGTNTGPGDHPPTGKAVNVSGASVSRYLDGKLVEEFVYLDALEYFTQLGIIEMPAVAASG